jgi:hypothetical protein
MLEEIGGQHYENKEQTIPTCYGIINDSLLDASNDAFTSDSVLGICYSQTGYCRGLILLGLIVAILRL